MASLKPTKDARTRYDKKTGAVRSFFGTELVTSKRAPGTTSRKTADVFLKENAKLLHINHLNLEYETTKKTNLFLSHRYHQTHNGIPVYGSHSQIAFRVRDKKIVSSTNRLDYRLPEDLSVENVSVSAKDALAYARKMLTELFGELILTEPILFIYRHEKREEQPPRHEDETRRTMLNKGHAALGKAYLVWQIRVDTITPVGYWELLVDATRKSLVAVFDRRRFDTLSGKVFWPDPITSRQDTSLSWNTPEAVLNSERVDVNLEHLNPPLSNGVYSLEGSWVRVVERELPTYPSPTTNSSFSYSAKDRSFLSVMAYYYIDRLVTLLRSFGVSDYNTATAMPIEVDAQGCSGDDNSHFVATASGTPFIAWGEGGVPDASDPGVILHEYGHALHYFLLGGSVVNSSYEEGFNDFLSCCFRDRFNTSQFDRANVFPWDNCPAIHWSDFRRCDLTERFDDEDFNEYNFYKKGNVFASALWDIYLNIGGDSTSPARRQAAADEMLHTYMETLLLVGDNEPPEDLAMGLIEVDEARTGGLYKKVIWDAFRRRGLWRDFTPEGNVDLTIRDSSDDTGEHPSPVVYWHSPDIWVRNNAPDTPGENPGDGHQSPINNIPNYLYVRVLNRGSAPAAAGNFSVEAFNCNPATGMLWPSHFNSMGTLSLPGNVAANGGEQIVGPFVWTPHIVGHECLVAVVHGASDPAIPSTLIQTVDHWKIVRFDNNVGQRNVSPRPSVPGGKVKAAFVARGATTASINQLSINATPLPADTAIQIRVPRHIVQDAAGLSNLTIESQNSRYITLSLSGGKDGIIRDFPMATGAEATVHLEIDFSYNAENGKTYPIVATQLQDQIVAGRLTIEIKAVKESEDYVYANPRSRELHTVHCPYWRFISQHHKIPYPSIQTALAAGYDGCAFCLPHHHTD